MNKLLLAILLIVPILVKAQKFTLLQGNDIKAYTLAKQKGFSIPLGMGFDFNKKQPVISLGLSYNLNNVVIGGEMKNAVTFDADKHNYLGFKAGYDVHDVFLHFIPSLGYYYDFVSEDKTNLNRWYLGSSLRVAVFGGDNVDYYFEAAYIKSFQLSIGFIFKP